jgi:hypothetical protein
VTRVYICEEWIPDKRYHRIEFCTDSALAADRWRRNGVRGHERRFVDYICYTKEEIEAKGLLELPQGVNDWSGKEQAAK